MRREGRASGACERQQQGAVIGQASGVRVRPRCALFCYEGHVTLQGSTVLPTSQMRESRHKQFTI